MNYNEIFKNHKATHESCNNFQILEFKIPDNILYNLRFVFDEKGKTLTISGDFGVFIVKNFETPEKFYDTLLAERTLENLPLHYFIEKIICSDRNPYYYDEEECIDHLLSIIDKPEEIEGIRETLSNHLQEETLSDHAIDAISEILLQYCDLDSLEIYNHIDDIPQKVSPCIETILVGFKYAWEQLYNNGDKNVKMPNVITFTVKDHRTKTCAPIK